jgi:hypothetical protein
MVRRWFRECIQATGAERVSQQQWPQARRARETGKKFKAV